MIITYTLLSKTIPEYSKRDGGVYTCSLGYCHEMDSLIRVYPLPLSGMRKWGRYRIEVEKNKRDSREESWKLSSYTRHQNFIGFDKELIYLGQSDKNIMVSVLFSRVYPSISKMNEKRMSVGCICSDNVNPFWDTNSRYINTNQVGMFEDVSISDFTKYMKETKNKECRIIFKDGDGEHNLQLNEWQYYEYQRKFKADVGAFRFIKKSSPNIILLGNMYQHRNSWLALGVFGIPSAMQGVLSVRKYKKETSINLGIQNTMSL